MQLEASCCKVNRYILFDIIYCMFCSILCLLKFNSELYSDCYQNLLHAVQQFTEIYQCTEI